MKIVILLLGAFVASTLPLYAQVPALGEVFMTANTDSLAQTLPQKTGTAKLSTLLSLCKNLELWETDKNGRSIYTDQLKGELKAFPQIKGHYLYFLAKQKASKNKIEEAYDYSKLAYEYYKNHHDTTGTVSALLNMGIIMLERETNSPKNTQFGHQYLEEAMAFCKNTSNPELKILYYYAYARFVGREAFNPQSTKLVAELKKALSLIEQHPQYISYKPFLLNILAAIYESKQQLLEAQKYTLEVVQLFQQYRGTSIPMSSLYNLALFSEMLQKYEQALFYYQQSMKRAHALGDWTFKYRWDVSMGIHASLVGLQKYKEAAVWADSIYTYAEKYNLFSTKTKLQNAVVAYEVEKKEARAKALEQEKQLVESQNKLFMGVGVAITLAFLVTIFLLYRLRQTNAKLKNAYDEILQLHQVRDYFFGIIAHDLRSPLNSFQEMAEVIKFYIETKRYDELKKISDGIDQMGLRIRVLLDNLLSWALSQRHELPHSPERLVLLEKILPITHLYQQVTSYKQATITVVCPTDLVVYMDANACDLIIRNLIDNASKNLRQGGEILIKAAYKETSNHVEFSVEDDGKGMSPEKLNQLTNTLHHPEISQNTPRGLGMILIGRFLQRNQISFGVKSVLGKGTTFNLMIPVAYQQI